MTVAFVDPPAGLAGDMLLGALVDAGLDPEVLAGVVRALRLDDVEIRTNTVRRGSLAATKVDVLVAGRPADGVPGGGPPPEHAGAAHRTLGDVVTQVRAAEGLAPEAVGDAVRTFELLARAEGHVHGRAAEEVHFHEVGAVDALVDVVGTCVGLRALGVTEVRCGPLPFFGGTVESAHGTLPLPAPAVLHLLEGLPTFPSGETWEQVTPTGAALVRALARGASPPAGFVPRRIGAGAGSYEGGRLPNVVRIVIGDGVEAERAAPTDVVLLQANLDDATGQEVARAVERALADGALDAWATPIVMKKGRPGLVLSVLASPGDVRRLEAMVLDETPTLGVRRTPWARTVLARRHETVRTAWGTVRMKVRDTPSGPAATPEHDDARRLAERHGVPLREVLDAARAAWASRARR